MCRRKSVHVSTNVEIYGRLRSVGSVCPCVTPVPPTRDVRLSNGVIPEEPTRGRHLLKVRLLES